MSARLQKGRRNVVALGIVSLFNDIASELVYPIIPVYLTTVLGASVAIVGTIEGIAEATANILKVFSGWLSDRLRHRKRFVTVGYIFSAVSKILLALSESWLHVLSARFLDRFGKGIRTSSRDALIADSTDPGTRGTAFGLHRAMDTVGAVVGPLCALVLLHLFGNRYGLIFLLASVPAFVGVAILALMVREPHHEPKDTPLEFNLSLRQFGKPFRLYVYASTLFALGNSSDAFLILRSRSLGFDVTGVVLLYVSFNAVYALLSYPLGKLSDVLGKRPMLLLSFFLFAAVYGAFGVVSERAVLWVLFPAYGIYMAMSEGIGKAYVTDVVPADRRATALGLFYTVTGLASFAASVVAGVLWTTLGSWAPFSLGALLAVGGGVVFLTVHQYVPAGS